MLLFVVPFFIVSPRRFALTLFDLLLVESYALLFIVVEDDDTVVVVFSDYNPEDLVLLLPPPPSKRPSISAAFTLIRRAFALSLKLFDDE